MRNYRYSQTSSNGVLRGHLDKFHHAEYLRLAAERGWTVQLVSQNTILRQVIAKPAEIAPRVPFSVDTAINYIVKFIVANDQVRVECLCYPFSLICLFQSLNVVENQQFRDLLTLFRPDFAEEDVPHRTKIRTAIIESWAIWFEGLKEILSVSICYKFQYLSAVLNLELPAGVSRKPELHDGYMVCEISGIIFMYHDSLSRL